MVDKSKSTLLKEKIVEFCSDYELVKAEDTFFDAKTKTWKTMYIPLTWMNNFNPRTHAVHMHGYSVKAEKYLFVLDIDASSLDEALRVSHLIDERCKLRFFNKYSGNNGVHKMFQIKLDDEFDQYIKSHGFFSIYQYAAAITMKIYADLHDEFVTLSPMIRKSKKLTLLDLQIHTLNHLIRAPYSFHPKSGLFSIPIKQDWTAEEIKEHASYRNIHKTFDMTIRVPVFKDFDYYDTTYKAENDKHDIIQIDYSKLSSNDLTMQILLEEIKTAPPCIQQSLITKDSPHALRFWVSVFLRNSGFTSNEVLSYWEFVLNDDKFNHLFKEELAVIKAVYSKPYNLTCQKMQQAGLCFKGCTRVL